jgi:hypothetical protein
LKLAHPFLHPVREGEVWDSLYYQYQTEEAQEQFHDQPSPNLVGPGKDALSFLKETYQNLRGVTM